MATLERQRSKVSQSRSLISLAHGVHCLRLSLVNVFFVEVAGSRTPRWVLVDAGLHFSHGPIAHAAEQLFGRGSRPTGIVLTHGHFDHVGALRALADDWDVPIFAHTLEHPYLTGHSSYPRPDPAVGGGAISFLSRIFPRGPIDVSHRLRTLPADGSVPGMPGWRWVFTPGHSPGHVSFFRDEDRTLIAGDAFVTVAQESLLSILADRGSVHRPPAYYTHDWEAARNSVAELLELHPQIAATGHGPPMAGEAMRRELGQLLRDWGRQALPPQGRYINEPALFDDRGVRRVPPPVFDPQLFLAGGACMAAVIGLSLLRRSHAASASNLQQQYR